MMVVRNYSSLSNRTLKSVSEHTFRLYLVVPLSEYAQAWSDLPEGEYHAAWKL